MKKNWVNMLPYAVAAVCGLAILAAGYHHISVYKEQVAELTDTTETQQQTINSLQQTIANLSQDNTNLKAAPAAPCTPPTTATTGKQSDIEEVLEPEDEEDADYQAKIDALKKRYEDMLVVYLLLKKCNRVQEMDYHVLISALSQEMASLDAPGRLQYDVLTSAQGSYRELYSNMKCEDPSITPMELKYRDFVNAVAIQFRPK